MSSTNTELPLQHARVCLRLCDLVYRYTDDKSEAHKEISEQLGVSQIKFLNLSSTDTQAVVVTINDEVYLSFRGSESPVDWLLNCFFELKPHLDGHSHSGFRYAVDQCFETIVHEVTKQLPESKKLIICGHSLGGAMAVMFAVKLQEKHSSIRIHRLVTFGQPRVGNKNFLNCVNVFNFPYLRFKNQGDHVPDVPPPFLKSDWSHCGELFLLSDSGRVETPEDESEAGSWKRLTNFFQAILQLWQSKASQDTIVEAASGPHSMGTYRKNFETAFNNASEEKLA